jgi:hypothetical protein
MLPGLIKFLPFGIFFSFLMIYSCNSQNIIDKASSSSGLSSSYSYSPSSVSPVSGLPLPYTEYEAENGNGNGTVMGPGTAYHTPEAEASGRKYVRLTSKGDYVQWGTTSSANSIVIRYSIPDSSGGGGITCPLDILVNGVLAKTLTLTSAYAWVYGSYPWVNNPGSGNGHKFFDEINSLLTEIYPGDTVTLVKKDNSASYILIDLIDLEQVPAPLTRPANSVSLADYSPAADGVTDDTSKLQACINAAGGGTVWVPAGTYKIGSLDVANVIIQGAGMWYTRFTGINSRFNCTSGNLKFFDFAIFGETSTRNDNSGAENGFNGNPGANSILQRIWVERKKCAFWVGDWNSYSPPGHLQILDCRFRDLMADAVNLCSGTYHSLIKGCLVRNSGDDGLACWTPTAGGPMGYSNSIISNTVQNPWFANGIAIYGGKDHSVIDNIVCDTVSTGSGLYISAQFGEYPFQGKILASGNKLIRCGANESDLGGPAGAIRIMAWDSYMTNVTIIVSNCDVIDSVKQGISIQANPPYRMSGVYFKDIRIVNSTTYGIDIRLTAAGSASFENVSISGSGVGAFVNSAGANFTVTKTGNNTGW